MARFLDFIVLLAVKQDPAGEKAKELMDSAAFYERLGLILGAVGIGIVVLGVILAIVRDARKKKQRQNPGPPSGSGP